MRKILYYITLMWLFPVVGVAYLLTYEVNKNRYFFGACGVWWEVKKAWRPRG